MTAPVIYLIRHGEKPPKNPDGSDPDGLSIKGIERAQGLRKTFGEDSPYHIKHIIAQHPKKDGSRTRPYDTIRPLAEDLGIKPDISIDRDDAKAAAKAALHYDGPGNVLICWEHGVLSKILKKIGVEEEVKYPGDRFDIIWSVKKPYSTLVWTGSEHIEGLDDPDRAVDGGVGILPSVDGPFTS